MDAPQSTTVWQQAMEGFPSGLALLDAETGETMWANGALKALLESGVGTRDVVGWLPEEYLPGLARELRLATMHTLQTRAGTPTAPQRLQFVHNATRNIAYWEWQLQAVGSAGEETPPRSLLLTVQAVSELVMNERLLATMARTAERARRRAEALGQLTQLVNASLTTPALLEAVAQKAAAYLGSSHAAVLLLNEDRLHLDIGYAMGLLAAGQPLLTCDNTAAGQAIQARRTLIITPAEEASLQMPRLDTGAVPDCVVTSPIVQNERVYGVVEVYFAESREIPEDALSLLASFADQTAIALSKADLYAEIAAQQGQLQLIFDNAPVGIVYLDSGGTAIAANNAARRYSACGGKVVGLSLHEYLSDLPAGLLEQVRAEGAYRASHLVTHSASGSEIICDVSLLPIRDKGRIRSLLLLLFDVSELVTARQEAEAARSEAVDALIEAREAQSQMVQMEKMRAVGELASGVAHDFNNALMAVLGYTELAEEELDDPEALSAHLAIIKKAALDASSTVQRLQQFARKRAVLAGQPTDCNVVVKDVVDLTRPLWRDGAQKKGITYDVRVNLEQTPPIVAEPSGLREVLINMVHNALNAMPDGGRLIFSTHAPDPHTVEISLQDSGKGMTPDVAARVFDPFFTTRGVEGTGLGLAVSWTIIQRHGGSIDVESEPGKGTRFRVRLPVEPPEGSTLSASAAPAPLPAAAPQTRILVVDDEPVVASVLKGMLTRRGYEVTTVHDAQEALRALRQPDADFALMLTDHGMPGMTGLQLIAEVRRNWPDLPVVLLTGWGDSVLQNNPSTVTPDVVLGKPVNQSDLLTAVATSLQGSKAQAN